MTTVGTGSGSFSNNNPRNNRSKKRKQLLVRRSMLETLESRQLMAVGPQLIGVQPNEGELISLQGGIAGATVLSTSPREIVLRFDDSAGIDPSTFSGIQVKRAGGDGLLSSAYISTDLGTNGRVVLDFSASLPGQQGNGQEIVFTQVSRTFGVNGNPASWPVLSVQGNRISIQVNTHPSFQTTAADLVRAMNADPNVASKVLTKRLRGIESEVIANTVPLNQVLRLDGADSARVSSNLNSGTNTLQVEFLSVQPSRTGNDIQIEVVSRDFGGAGAPNVTVTGNKIRVEINSNARFSTSVNEFINAINNSTDASLLARARLVSGSPTTRIGANPTTYSPLTLVGGDDVSIQPSHIGFGETDREVVIRFAETLPDDFYLIDIIGTGPYALRNVAGQPFNSGISQSVRFDLDLGTTIQSVVPQPVVRDANGNLSQLRNVVHVYFNDDDLNATAATNPAFYQLVYTNDTLTGLDDLVFTPTSVNYDAVLNRSTVSFDRNLDALVHPTTGAALAISALRLRIGNDQIAAPSGVTLFTPASEPGSRFDSATDLGGGWAAGNGAKSVIVDSEIRNTTPYVLDFPGANNEAGNRDNRYQHHVTSFDANGIPIIAYNFAAQLGTVNNSLQLNAITDTQKDLVRQIFSLYEKYLGVRFVESNSLGLTVAVGDMTAISPFNALTAVQVNGRGGLTYAAGSLRSNLNVSAVIVDIQDYNSSEQNVFGSELFRSFMRGIGVLLGLGTADELPQSTVQNNSPLDQLIAEAVYPGNADIVHGQFVLRPEGKDIDLYRFTLPSSGGRVNIEISAERLANSSVLDASLKLYRNAGTTAAPRWVEVAANEDYFSKDPRINLDLKQGGEYIVGVSAKGNTSYDPTIEDSGMGGKSEGRYELRIDFQPPAASTLVDIDGTATALDGDGDGRPGGVHNYWFVPTRPDRGTTTPGQAAPAHTIWVDKTANNGGTGTLAAPYNTISAALAAADAAAKANPTVNKNVVVRILGNTQNRSYEIGFNRLGNALADGSTFDVPKDVTVMIEAGAIIKLGRASIGAGSSTVSVDRSGGSLQVLGTPDSKVIITSINDTVGVGLNPDRNPPSAAPGDWGGIEFRNNIDGSDETRTNRERDGLFLNSVVHADIRYGGGQVFINGVSQVITPINMIDSRPTIANNLVTFSADAAMSATPNSFREDNFLDPRSQSDGHFVADYDRVGPDIHGNTVTNNTLNGLFIRTRTGAAETLESVTVSARFDDIDIPHIIGENLVIKGQPGGGILESQAPPVSVVTVSSGGAGTLAAGTYNYKLVYVDAAGNESLASLATSSITLAANGAIRLNNLPPIGNSSEFVARRIYRSDATGGGTYKLAGQINAVSTTFLDNGSLTGGNLATSPTKIRSRLDGSLVIDGGTILKVQGTRIEVTTGGNLIAEGTPSLPVVFTSVNDPRFGIGGTSNTTNSQPQRTAAPGDWGGIFIGHGSSASLDNVRVAYAGGATRSEGGFASFNPIEVHQADFRLSNSRVENSLDGTQISDDPTRTGRGNNDAASVFVRGAQPIIVNNKFSNNDGAAISIDVNSLTSETVTDPGRMTGEIGDVVDRIDNRGALVRGNRITNSSLNGMLVRGQTLTTQSVWDDTDIVHIVDKTITSSNLHTYGGLILKSASNESLVVKFGGDGELPGIVATGSPSDNPNRIGGSVQIVGQPNFPVVLTSLADDSVGAGFGLDGRPSFDTDNNGTSGSATSVVTLPTGPEVNRGTTIDNDVDVNRPGYFSYTPGPGGGVNLGASAITAQGSNLLMANEDVIYAHHNYIDLGANGGAVQLSATTITMQPTLISPDLVASEGTFTGNNGATVRWRVESRFDNGVAKLNNTVILESDQALGEMSFINYLDEDIELPDDDFLYVVGTPGEEDFRVYTIDERERVGFSHGGIYKAGPGLQNATFTGWTADEFPRLQSNLIGDGTQYTIQGNINTTTIPPRQDPVLGQIYGLADVTTAFAWRIEPTATSARVTTFLELVPTTIERLATPGAWDGITVETYSNDRNVAVVSEKESSQSSAPSVNNLPSQAQYLGQLSRQASGGDENARLGFEIHGAINKPTDVDVYSFNANGRTEVWLDIDRTSFGLDTVVELIAADGTILALSDDSFLEETAPATNPIYSSLGGNAANPLRKSAITQVAVSAAGDAKDDYSTNPKDAGLRVVLPGQSDVVSLYHIRVRSSNQIAGKAGIVPLSDPASLTQGLSRGSYQLQVRLREAQEFPGSSISYADIRYATDAVTLSGVPKHSPLTGETAEVENATVSNNAFANAQHLGNILSTDRRTISVAGSLTDHFDIDWYSFDIQYNQLLSPLTKYLSTVFDIDYADGIGRADMSMYLFNPDGRLIHLGEDSNILDDRATSLNIANNTDLSRGSTGTLDPFIGSVELPAGRYFLAITGTGQIPTVLNNSGDRNAAQNDSGTRVQPLNNGQYIAEDRVGNDRKGISASPTVVPQFLPQSSRVEFMLGDVPLYLLQETGGNGSHVYLANPFTGELINNVGASIVDLDDIAIRPNGDIRGFRGAVGDTRNDANASYVLVDPGTGATTVTGGFGATTRRLNGEGQLEDANTGFRFNAITFASALNQQEWGFAVINRAAENGVTRPRNVLYRFDANTGAASAGPLDPNAFNIVTDGSPNPPDIILGAGTNINERGFIETGSTASVTTIAVREATEVLGAVTRRLIEDGDIVSLQLSPTGTAIFEFNAGPQFSLNSSFGTSTTLEPGDQFVIDGVTYEITPQGSSPATPGAQPVFYSPNMTAAQFVGSLKQAMPVGIQVGFDGNRVNFMGATTATFTSLINRGVATEIISNGNVGSGRIAVNFLAEDTPETIAIRLAQAVNTAGILGLSAVANGETVQFANATVVTGIQTEAFKPMGVAPGGDVTGIAQIGEGDMFAVSNLGGLYRISRASLDNASPNSIGTYVSTSHDLIGLNFTSLTAGPRNAGGGQYADILFGTTSDGFIYAFDTAGRFANVFANGAHRVQTGVGGLSGLAFSNLDYNLWHMTDRRANDAGHGINVPTDRSDIAENGGTSWYFGFENRDANNNGSYTDFTNPLAQPRSGGTPLANTYNFPGGAAGVLESKSFSLEGMAAADKPTLYFNYFLSTEDINSAENVPMRDSFRVYAQGDNGQWLLLATNNDNDEQEFAQQRLTDNLPNATTAPGAAWRQARLDLGALAGNKEVRLRFEFSTAGGLGHSNSNSFTPDFSGARSTELKIVGAELLADGQTFQVAGKTFELEMGEQLVIPSGSGVDNLEQFSIRGTTFTMWDGTGTAPAGQVIQYSVDDSPSLLATRVRLAIQTATFTRPTSPLSLTDPIGGSDILNRPSSTVIQNQFMRYEGVGAIGDNASLAPNLDQDVDIVRMNLSRGTVVNIGANATGIASPLNPLVRIFDQFGNQLGINDDTGGTVNSSLQFTVPADGVYFIGVSASLNSRYNPSVLNSGISGGSQGQYTLTVDVTPALQIVQNTNRLQIIGDADIQLGTDSNLNVQGQNGLNNGAAVPVYITQNMNSEQVAEQVKLAMEIALTGSAEFESFSRRGAYLDVTGVNVGDAGPFSVTNPRFEDNLSEWNYFTPNGRPALRAQNNAFEGVYLDDFIIGLAERGEQVTGARADSSFVAQEFVYGPSGGTYQLEIRGGSDYGIPQGIFTPRLDIELVLDEALEPNAPMANTQSVVFNPSGLISDGQTMVLSDGAGTIVLEFDDEGLPAASPKQGVVPGHIRVPFNSSLAETGSQIARRVRDIINSPVVQNIMQIGAISSDGLVDNSTSNRIFFVGSVTITVPDNVGTYISTTGTGDKNTPREQGQIIVENTRISNSSGFGVVLDAGGRDATTNNPAIGSVRNTITLNNDRIAPGAVIVNNELVGNINGGIRIEGDTATGDVPAAAVPFARIVNNTILGGTVTPVTTPAPTTIANDFYALGSVSFADRVVSYTPASGGGPIPQAGLQTPDAILGTPNYTGVGEPQPGQGAVSLGRGGSIVVQFTNNFLTGSGDARPDLAIYEVGNAETVRVEVSADGRTYTPVGSASFSNRYIDLDAFGFTNMSQLQYVRLTDDANQGETTGLSVGADIDAVGALSSRPGLNYTAGGVGISVGPNASPTLLNNVVVNNATGVSVDATSTSTVVGGTLFQHNGTNTTGLPNNGQFPLVVDSSVPLFLDPATGNLYPVAGSPVIDASIDSLADRALLIAVKQSLGLLPSPIITPRTDITGQLRVDDPAVATPPGMGESVFKDRGASDRSDISGPIAVPIAPIDNDALGVDRNPEVGVVEVIGKNLPFFDIQLLDTSLVNNATQGVGIDPRTVSPNAIVLTRNGDVLVEGIDYRFAYDTMSNIIRLTPLAGLWESESVYQIRYVTTNESSIQLSEPSATIDGTTYSIIDANGTTHYFELDTGIRLSLPQTNNGISHNIPDGSVMRIDDGTQAIAFEFDSDGSTSTTGAIVIEIDDQDTPSVVAERVAAAIQGSGLNLRIRALGGPDLQILSSQSIQFTSGTTNISVSGNTAGMPAYGFQIPTVDGQPTGIVDGQTFSIQRANTSIVFEFDSNGTLTGSTNVRVPMSGSTSTLASAIVAAINGASLGLTATTTANGLISVGTQADLRLMSGGALQVVGSPGRAANPLIEIDLQQVQTAGQIATLLANAIKQKNLPGVSVTVLNSRIFIEGAQGVSGLNVLMVSGIRDYAGNPMRATELDGSSLTTIFLGEGLDYGDAPDPLYPTKKDSNGPRHTIVDGFSIGPTVTADADARLNNLDTDDGVTIQSMLAGFNGSIVVNVQGITVQRAGFVNAWIDFNGNGIFESNEKLNVVGRIANGNNTISFNVPASAVTDRDVALRVRLSSTEVLAATGPAADGEVEDYMIRIAKSPYQNPNNRLDVNGDGAVSPIDVLTLINKYDEYRGQMLPIGLSTPPYLDVDGDGALTPLDILTVINYINSRPVTGAGSGEGEFAPESATTSEIVVSNYEDGIVPNSSWSAAPAPVIHSVNNGSSTASISPASQSGNSGFESSVDVAHADLFGSEQASGNIQSDETVWMLANSEAEKEKEDDLGFLLDGLVDELS